ncbi:hypothetical protein P691DRAFT_813009 [Macrolepiota fuliginosa MF-IS2]|uniref:F-box domain-containing protein n=1 Tax=Macrolepiota fuliginosa MF-IS2 TaxID=1400762 RepID=A0A9P5XN90_9AGAR|nr:hypothetical protein P691DRAFT_813009 [Macrolepiota fuliginosa MF-IS2]
MSSIAAENYLPSELLLIIFDHLEYGDLYRLTSVSSKFNHLSLIVYFARRKIVVSPDGRVDLPNAARTMEMLPFIRKAPFVKSINRLSCGLLQPHKSFLENISHLTTILRNVESVEEFVLDFFVAGPESWTPTMIKQAKGGTGLVSALNELFTTAARVSRSVMVRNGTSLRAVLQKADKANNSTKSWSFGQVTRLFSEKSSSKHGKKPPTPVSDAPCISTPSLVSAKGALQALEINSIILLSPPFLDWTIRALNANEITDLTFGTIEFRDVDWHGVLSQLHIPTLKKLTFRGYTPVRALVDFTVRHQGITTLAVNNLNLDDWYTIRPSSPSDNGDASSKLAKAFTNVKSLTCCPQGLAILLSPMLFQGKTLSPTSTRDNITATSTTPDIFPNLRAISVIWSISIGQQLKMSIIGDILEPVAHKFKSYERVTFAVTYRADAGASWRAPVIPVPAQISRGLQGGNSLVVSTSPSSGYSGANAAATGTAAQSHPLFTYFTKIKLEVTPRADKEGVADFVKGLAEALTCVKRIDVDTRSKAGRFAQENRSMKVLFCYHILTQFKKLQAVYIDGVRSKLTGCTE